MPEYDMPRPRFRADDPDQEKQMRKIISWLLQQDEKIRYILNNLDEENFSEGLTTQLSEAINIAANVNGVAQKEEIDDLTGRVKRAETAISQHETEIRAKASQQTVDALGQRVSDNEANIALVPDAITAAVEAIDEFRTRRSEIELTADRTKITTPEFVVNINEDGTEERALQIDKDGAVFKYMSIIERLIAPNVPERYTGATSITIGPGDGNDYKTFNAFSSGLNGRVLDDDITITMTGMVADYAKLYGVTGQGSITINWTGLADAGIRGQLSIKNCQVSVDITGLVIVGPGSNGAAVLLQNDNYVRINECEINGNAGFACVQMSRGTTCVMIGCQLDLATDLIAMEQMCKLDARNLMGSGTHFLSCGGSIITWDGTRPQGALNEAWACVTKPADLENDLAADPGIQPSQETPMKNAIRTATLTGYWKGDTWQTESTIKQGVIMDEDDEVICTGGMMFDLSDLRGSVGSANLQLTRLLSEGKSGAVAIKLYTANAWSINGDAPTLTGGVTLGSIAPGETKQFDVPTSYVTLGQSNGLFIKADDTETIEGRSYSENYAAFDGYYGKAPVLTVTYQ